MMICLNKLQDASIIATKNVPTSYNATLYAMCQQINCVAKGTIATTLPVFQ